MNSGQKTAVSLVLTAGLFVAFIFTYYTNLFTKIETQFYEPERISQARSRLTETSDFCNSYIQNLLDDLSGGYVKEDAVKSFLSQTPSESEVTNRVQLSGELFSKYSGLEGFRLIDKNGRDIHYSSYSDDVTKQSGTTRVYKNYSDVEKIPGEMKFESISIPENEYIISPKVTFNSEKSLLNLSFPVFDKYDVFRGIFVFNFRISDLERELIKANHISVSDTLTLFSADDSLSGGFVIGMPKVGREFFPEPVLQSWKSKSSGPDKIVEAEGGNYWVVLSDYGSKYLSISEAYHSDYFELPTDTRILICVCVFITVFLLLFLLLSFKHDDMVVIRSRIKKIQFALIAEYLENKQNVDWAQVSRQIVGRKTDLFNDVKKSLGHKGKKHAKEVDALLNKSWDEILSAVGSRQEYQTAITQNDAASSAEIKRMLEEVLSTTQLKVQNVQLPEVEEIEEVTEVLDAEIVDDIEAVEEIEEIEEIDEAEEVSDAALGEVEEIEEIDEAEEVSDAALGEVEEIEEIDEAEEVSDAALDEAEEIEEIEEVLDAETLDEVEEIEEAESLDEVEAIEEVESLDAAEEIEEIEDIVDVPEVSDSEVADVEAAEEIEEFTLEDFGIEDDSEIQDQKKKEREELFAEDIGFGVVEPEKPAPGEEEKENFEASNPDFGEEYELEPIEQNAMFSMTSFGNNTNYVAELGGEAETIVEVNGIFKIADNLEVSKVDIDKDFKKLVDSVLSV